MTAKAIGDIAYIGMSVGLMLLAGGFLFLTRWWKTPVGRSLAAFLGMVALIMLWTFLLLTRIIALSDGGIYILRAVLFSGLCLASWGMLIGFVKTQFFPRGLRSWRSTRRNSREEVP